MKISDALKDLKLVEKKIQKKTELIQKYSSEMVIGDNKLTFGTEEEQKAEVDSLLQGVEDLVAHRGKIRRALALTNASVFVEMNGMAKSITEWVEYRQYGAEFLIQAYNALNDLTSQRQAQAHGKIDITAGVKALRFFDEKVKNEKLAAIHELRGDIDKRLETVNATTELVVPLE